MKCCIACRKMLPAKPLFVLEDAPASAQDIPDAEEVKNDQGVRLELYQCAECGLVQFGCAPVSYYRDVIRAGGFSTTMTGLRRSQYRHLIETYHLEGKKFLEVGCGRGEFIKVLTEFPVQVYGMEHKPDLVEIAQAEGLCVWREFPEREDQVFAGPAAEMLPRGRKPEGSFDVFLSFNFLEHQPNPDVMLRAIYHNLEEDGMGLVTVPALEYIVEQGSYYELIRDHIAYYSFDTLRALLERCGFAVLEEKLINRDTIAMIVKKQPGAAQGGSRTEKPAPMRSGGIVDGQTPEMTGAVPAPASTDAPAGGIVASLVTGHEVTITNVDQVLQTFAAEGKTLAVWGASHQGFTLAATTGLGRQAKYIIDSAPFKQGRFAPASHLPIVPPDYFFEEPVDAVLIVAPGYTDEIADIIRTRFGAQVQIMTMRTDRIERLA